MYRTLFLISSQKRKSALEEIMEVSSSKKVVMLQNKQTGFTYVTWTKREYFRFTNKLCVFFFLKMEEQKKMKISRKDNWIAKVSKS